MTATKPTPPASGGQDWPDWMILAAVVLGAALVSQLLPDARAFALDAWHAVTAHLASWWGSVGAWCTGVLERVNGARR